MCSVDNSPPAPCGFGKDGNWRTPGLKEGEHEFSLTAEDLFGNTAPILRRRWTVGKGALTFPYPLFCVGDFFMFRACIYFTLIVTLTTAGKLIKSPERTSSK